VRDLARAEPWRKSIERSRVRREKSARSAKPVARVRGVVAVALVLPAPLAVLLGGHGHRASVPPARGEVNGTAVAPGRARSASGCRAAAAAGGRRTCPLVVTSTAYVNPLAGASVKPERIDMGVDYAGSGTLVAIGTARLTYVATSGTGWPGAFIEYRLLGGPDAGRYVYCAEGVIPTPRLHVGQTVAAGQAIATIIPDYETGIELGWGAGANTKTYAQAAGQWSATDDAYNLASPAGKGFSALIAALGGPPGKVEG
jgi:multidrug efflux pump subunit AcrA (membrane-fusion protein)